MKLITPAVILIIAALTIFVFTLVSNRKYITFSDSAKFAVISRNFVQNNEFKVDFYNFVNIGNTINSPSSVEKWIPPVTPNAYSVFMRFFGINDTSVIIASSFFQLASVLILYFLAKRLSNNIVAMLSSLSFLLNINFLEYSVSGASETLFTLEILLTLYLFTLKKKWLSIFGIFILILMYFTKAQAIIYIFGCIFYYLLLNFSLKKAYLTFIATLVLGGILFLIISRQGIFAVTQHVPGIAISDALRGAEQTFSFQVIFKKLFYNIYNFYRLMPQIMNPYLWALFIMSLLRWYKNKSLNALKISTIFMVLFTFFITAATIPFFRYIHPVVPLVYFWAIEFLVWLVNKVLYELEQISDGKFKSLLIKNRNNFINLGSIILVFIFAIGPSLGFIFLDSRFDRKMKNLNKQPVYVQLSRILRDNTNKDDFTVTNLDTWASWYGERNTVWFPLEPKQIVNSVTGEITFDAIYLTSYLIDDENYYMGESWRQIFENPEFPEMWTCEGCDKIRQEFELKGTFIVPASETYEKTEATAVLFTKKVQ